MIHLDMFNIALNFMTFGLMIFIVITLRKVIKLNKLRNPFSNEEHILHQLMRRYNAAFIHAIMSRHYLYQDVSSEPDPGAFIQIHGEFERYTLNQLLLASALKGKNIKPTSIWHLASFEWPDGSNIATLKLTRDGDLLTYPLLASNMKSLAMDLVALNNINATNIKKYVTAREE